MGDSEVGLRNAVSTAVRVSCVELNPKFRLKGSFARGDFHLARDGRTSFSDVDLLLPDDGRDRHDWERDVREAIESRGWCLRVSVQHHDYLRGVSVEDSLLLAYAESVRFFPDCATPGFAPYLLAKSCLTVWGAIANDPLNRSRPDSARWRQAFDARTGRSQEFNLSDARACLSPIDPLPSVVPSLLKLFATGDHAEAVADLIPRLRKSAVHPWLKLRLEQLIATR